MALDYPKIGVGVKKLVIKNGDSKIKIKNKRKRFSLRSARSVSSLMSGARKQNKAPFRNLGKAEQGLAGSKIMRLGKQGKRQTGKSLLGAATGTTLLRKAMKRIAEQKK